MSQFIDLHLHLLWNVDDGCRTPEDSLSLAQTLVQLGFVEVAPSPHNRSEYADKATCLARLKELEVLLAEHRVPLKVHPNAENFFLDEGLLVNVNTEAFRPMGKTGKFMLVEAPYQTPLPHLLEIIFRLKLKQVTPVIAHPERCAEFERKGRAAQAVAAGAVLQLDFGALTGRYGRMAENLARSFLADGLYAIAATDIHSPTKAQDWLEKSFVALEKAVGAAGLKLLFSSNPRRILEGKALES